MIRITQHVRLGRPVSPSISRRLVYRAATDGRPRSSSSSFVLSSAVNTPARTFSSSRRYATVLQSTSEPSTSSNLGADALSTPGASTSSSKTGSGRTMLLQSRASEASTVLVAAPSAEALEESGEELVAETEARFRISERAAERLRAIAQTENNSNVALRVAVESGGCHGYQYKIDLTDLSEGTGDYHFALPRISPSNVLIDPTSLGLLSGATLDFATELIGSTFRVTENPHAMGGCGCGVSWEAKI